MLLFWDWWLTQPRRTCYGLTTRMVTAVGVTRAVGTAKEAWWQGEPQDLEKLLVAIDKGSAILSATKIHLRPTEAK